MSTAPLQDRMQWDSLPVAHTRPAMKGGLPVLAIIPVCFGPCILVLFTFQVWLMLLTPVLWVLIAACYATNLNRPFEYILWALSGAAFKRWKPWGGISFDPHGTPSDKDIFF